MLKILTVISDQVKKVVIKSRYRMRDFVPVINQADRGWNEVAA
jgi:hypothetical protein